MKAIILAGGKGSRLQPLTDTVPKPLLEVGGKPILQNTLEELPESITETIIVTGYLSDRIENWLRTQTFPFPIKIAMQDSERKGTLAALESAKDLLEPGEHFMVLGGDDWHVRSDLEKFACSEYLWGVQETFMPGYHAIETDKQGFVCGMNPPKPAQNCWPVATGVYTLDSGVFSMEPVQTRDGEYGLPQTLLAHKSSHPLRAVQELSWHPINTKEDLEHMDTIISGN